MAGQREFWNSGKETRTREEREAEVLSLMQRQLYAYEKLPFYRRHYDRAGFHPDRVTSIASFTEHVPIITKQMLRDDQAEHAPFGSYLGSLDVDICRIHGSSGTSGKPTLYAISRGDWDYIADVMAQAFFTCGVRPGDVVQLATVFSLFMGGWGSLLGIERLGATAFPVGAGETERQIELMWRVKSTVLVTTPSYALHMLEVARSMGLDPSESPLRLGMFTLTWAEAVPIDWGIILLYGGGLAFGELAFATGLAETVGRGLAAWLPVRTPLTLTMLFTAFAILVSEATSSTVTATMVVPMAIAVAQAAGVRPLEPALGATLGASMGFMMPISAASNAIVYGSGYVPITAMIRHGLVCGVAAFLIIVPCVLMFGQFLF